MNHTIIQTTTSHTISKFVSQVTSDRKSLPSTFDDKFNNGWLKFYYPATVVFLLLSIVSAIMDIVGAVNIGKIYAFGHILGYICYCLLSLVLASFFYFSFDAIKTKSVDKQDIALKIIAAFNFGIMFYTIAYIGCAGLSTTIDFAFLLPAIPLTLVGFVFLILASNVKKAMLGKGEDALLF